MQRILKYFAVFIVFVISNSNSLGENISSLIVDYENNVTPEQSVSDKEFIKVMGSKLFELKTPLDFTNVPGVSVECHRDFVHYLNALQTFDFWALKMFDANGQMPIGILSGNVNMFGHFQQCLNIGDESNLRFRGKHCFAELQPFVTEHATYLTHLHRLAQSFELMKSTFNDPGHVFSRFSTITYGICIPSTCSHEDVEEAVKYYVNNFTQNTGIRFDVQVNEPMCHVKDSNRTKELGRGEKLTIGFFVIICILSLMSSIYDANGIERKNSWLTSFSVKRNWRQVTSLERSEDDIKVVHGLRFLNAIFIFFCHKSVETLIPSINRTEMALVSAGAGSIFIRMCALYTDVFLMLSGMLVAYSLAKKLKRGQKINAVQEIVERYIRVMPNIIVCMLTTAYVIPLFVNQSPQKALVIEKPAQLCKTYGWRNLLMIHNWFKFEDMCNLHSHHVGSDFELFLLAPILLTVLWKWPKRGCLLVLALGTASTIARFYVTYTHELMYFVPFGAKLSKLLETANLLYTLPTHRFTVYGVGLILGFVLRKYSTIKPSKAHFIIGEIINGVLIAIVIACGVMMTGVDVKYNLMLHSLYAAFAPIIYCVRVAWIIFSAHQGYKSSFNRFLEWRGFVITTRFCYAFYLIQIPIFQLSIANMKSIQYYGSTSMINLNEIFVICSASILLTLFIETPFNNIKKLIFKRSTLDENSNCEKTKIS